MSYLKNHKMKNIILLLLITLPIFSIAQSQYEVTPKKYWINDVNFEDKIHIDVLLVYQIFLKAFLHLLEYPL